MWAFAGVTGRGISGRVAQRVEDRKAGEIVLVVGGDGAAVSRGLGGGAGHRGGVAASIRARFAAVGGVEMPAVAREPMRAPPSLGE